MCGDRDKHSKREREREGKTHRDQCGASLQRNPDRFPDGIFFRKRFVKPKAAKPETYASPEPYQTRSRML